MARGFPSDFGRLYQEGAQLQELETFERLVRELPADFGVFYSRVWTVVSGSKRLFGEIDFVVVAPSGRTLFIEQKSGALEHDAQNRLIKRYPGDVRKPVASQIQRSLAAVREKFARQHQQRHQIDADYLLYVPHARVIALRAIGLEAARIVDSTRAERLIPIIEGLARDAPVTDKPASAAQVEAFLRDELALIPDLPAVHARTRERVIRFGGLLAETVERIEMNPLRLRVRGTAGCGKSILAGRLAQRFQAEGRRVLVLCFNRPLRERLRTYLPATLPVYTFYMLCDRFLQSRGEFIDFSSGTTDNAFWQTVQDRVIETVVPDDWRFDALIVDEGQDFEAAWFEIVQLFLNPGAAVLWLEDPEQNLLDRPPLALTEFVGFRVEENYRSPQALAPAIEQLSERPVRFLNPEPGWPPRRIALAGQDLPTVVAAEIDHWLGRGLVPTDIAVISLRGLQSMSAFTTAGRHRLRHFTGYQADGRQVFTEGEVLLDSIYRFKGLQAPVLILIDGDGVDPDCERGRRLLYCAFSRPTLGLSVVTAEPSRWQWLAG